jgi:hypothetical protein
MDRRRRFAGELLVDDRAAHGIEMRAFRSRRESKLPDAANDLAEHGVSRREVSDRASRAARNGPWRCQAHEGLEQQKGWVPVSSLAPAA